MLGSVRALIVRLLSVKSSRGVSFTLSGVALASKPFGYLRTLITAWAFGTSAGMDSFHLATGIVTLIAGSVGSAMDSAVLPELSRTRKLSNGEEASNALIAVVAWVLIVLLAFFCLVVVIAPGVLVRFFARGFDAERIRIGAVMLWWLLPFAVVVMCKPLLDVWALFNEKYTLASLCSTIFNLIAIPALLLLIPLVGVYAVAASMSVGHLTVFLLFFTGLGGIPLFFRRSALPLESLRTIGRNVFYSLIIVAASPLFMIVDRYFASLLPVGSVSAISYAGSITGIVMLAVLTPLSFFLARISNLVVEDGKAALKMTESAIAILFAYFLPVGFFLAAAARPLISLIYGWGNFDENSVYMTTICLTAYSYGMVFWAATTLIYRYAQALQRLGLLVVLTYAMMLLNVFLDWLMVRPWGLWGLAFATSLTQLTCYAAYHICVVRAPLWAFLRRACFFPQVALLVFFSWLVRCSGSLGVYVPLFVAVVLAVLHLHLIERLSLVSLIPPAWRPSALFHYFVSIFFRQEERRL